MVVLFLSSCSGSSPDLAADLTNTANGSQATDVLKAQIPPSPKPEENSAEMRAKASPPGFRSLTPWKEDCEDLPAESIASPQNQAEEPWEEILDPATSASPNPQKLIETTDAESLKTLLMMQEEAQHL